VVTVFSFLVPILISFEEGQRTPLPLFDGDYSIQPLAFKQL